MAPDDLMLRTLIFGGRFHVWRWNEYAQAIALFEEAIRIQIDDRALVSFIKFDPSYDIVRSDPRFDALISRLHLPGRH